MAPLAEKPPDSFRGSLIDWAPGTLTGPHVKNRFSQIFTQGHQTGTRGPGTPWGAYLGQTSVLLAPGGHLKGPQWAVFEQKAESWDGERGLQEASTTSQTSKFANPQRLPFERAADRRLMSTDEHLTHIAEMVMVGGKC